MTHRLNIAVKIFDVAHASFRGRERVERDFEAFESQLKRPRNARLLSGLSNGTLSLTEKGKAVFS